MIQVGNIYHMLAYAFRILDTKGYRDMATEEFDNTADLMAEILARGVSSQLKRGLVRGYVPHEEALSSPRGKAEIGASIATRAIMRRQVVCSYDEYSPDVPMNRILKATMRLLLHSDAAAIRKRRLKSLLPFFSDVADIRPTAQDWHRQYDRSNQSYRMLIGICELVWKGLLQKDADGSERLADSLDDQRLSNLYEHFILEYYRREHPEVSANAPFIPWALDDGNDDLLPIMRSDVTLARDSNILIIDAKWYGHVLQERFGKKTVHSANLYQMFAYVKNEDEAFNGMPHHVSGMLLYAGTDEIIQPDVSYSMSGNEIAVRTLNLEQEWTEVQAQLDSIVERYVPGRVY